MSKSVEEKIKSIEDRLDFYRRSGRPVPLILEAKLTKLKLNKKIDLPWFSKKGFLKRNR